MICGNDYGFAALKLGTAFFACREVRIELFIHGALVATFFAAEHAYIDRSIAAWAIAAIADGIMTKGQSRVLGACVAIECRTLVTNDHAFVVKHLSVIAGHGFCIFTVFLFGVWVSYTFTAAVAEQFLASRAFNLLVVDACRAKDHVSETASVACEQTFSIFVFHATLTHPLIPIMEIIRAVHACALTETIAPADQIDPQMLGRSDRSTEA